MKTNQHIIKSAILTIMLIMGAIFAPIFAFAQQTEPTKTVNIVVKLQSKTAEKEIIQLPADNQPKVVHGAKIYAAKKTKPVAVEHPVVVKSASSNLKPTAVKNVTKEPLSAVNKTVATAKLKPATVAKPVQKKEAPVVAVLKPTRNTTTATAKPQIAATKSTVSKQEQAKETTVATTSNSLKPSTESLKPNASVSSNATKTMVAVEKAKVAAEDSTNNPNAHNTNIQASNSDKQNTISYVWIGVILIIAGIILGLLFGRTAFLVSFVGVIFILLGVFIF